MKQTKETNNLATGARDNGLVSASQLHSEATGAGGLTHTNTMQTKTKRWIVRCLAGGYIIGGCLEDMFGKPLTIRTAKALAKFENERSTRRREQKLAGAFDYYAEAIN